MPLPDINEFYERGDNAAKEEAAWTNARFFERYAEQIVEATKLTGAVRPKVVELCCGSGWVPLFLGGVDYLGIDATPQFIEWAKERSANCVTSTTAQFVLGDIRSFEPEPCDVVAMFAALKHFGLHEWDEIVAHALSWAPVGVLEVAMWDSDIDSGPGLGQGFHHVFVTREHAEAAISAAGHEIVRWLEPEKRFLLDDNGIVAMSDGRPGVEATCLTKRQ